jgi:hypothetical protein
LTNEIIYNGNLSRLRKFNWDFSHLDVIIETLLNQRPDHDVYLYGSVESAEDYSRPSANNAVQAPIIVAICLPTGRVPTRTVGYYRNQTVVERINSFKSLLHSNRLYYLTCDADFSSVPDADSAAYYEHEHTSLFVLTPRDITTNNHGNFVVDSLTFDFTHEDGEECTEESWHRSDGVPPREHLDEIVDVHFGDASEEVRARSRENIQQVSHPITAVQCYHQYDLIALSLSPSF